MAEYILLIEDEQSVQQLVKLYLEKEGFYVLPVSDGKQGLEIALNEEPDLILLDIMLPGMDGRDVCKEIRKHMPVPIIMLTAKGDEYDRITGLDMGADDYILKPFSPREMVARVNAVLRRTAAGNRNSPAIELTNLRIHPASRQVKIGDKNVEMPPKEFDLLYFLARNLGQAYSREQLLNSIWGYSFVGDPRTVDTHVKRLRKKLEDNSCSCSIKTLWGYGYKFEAEKNV